LATSGAAALQQGIWYSTLQERAYGAARLRRKKLWINPGCPLISDKSEMRISAFGVVIMRVDVRDSLAQWFDEKPWRFKLILLLHRAVVGAIVLIFGIRF
jgi:hypothetical protein